MASTYLERTPASAGNRRTFTISFWIKRSQLSSAANYRIFHALGNTNRDGLLFENDYFRFFIDGGTYNFTTNALYRDTSAWYHIVVAVDTTQSTSSNRVKIYINGSQVTSFSAEVYPTQNFDMNFNTNTVHRIGRDASSSTNYFDGSIASFYFIDGQALNATSFGETDATTGIWKPKSYSGSYGTNGFFLKFENSGSLGTDSSGNGNNFTVNGTPTQTVDTPSNVFATYNPLMNKSSGVPTMSNGNLTLTTNSEEFGSVSSIGASQGKWYCELKWDSGLYAHIGITGDPITLSASSTAYAGVTNQSWGWNFSGNILNNDTVIATYSSYSTGDIIGIALDLTNNKLYFSKNGTFQNSANPSAGTNGISITASSSVKEGNYFIFAGTGSSAGNSTISANFGNGFFGTTAISSPYADGAGLGKFQYQPPTGYYSLCTKNINVYG